MSRLGRECASTGGYNTVQYNLNEDISLTASTDGAILATSVYFIF